MEYIGAECRSQVAGDTLSGHAAVFGRLARLNRSYEALARTAFDDVLAEDVRALINHDKNRLLGRVGAGTLKLAVDDSGLYFEVPKLPNTTYANDLRESVERGDMNGMSFGFLPGSSRASRARDGLQIREHTRLKHLLDVSPVTFPAYEGTDVVLRDCDFSAVETNESRLIKARAAVLFGRKP